MKKLIKTLVLLLLIGLIYQYHNDIMKFIMINIVYKDETIIKDELINKTANSGIVKKGTDIQIIFGLQVPEVRNAVEEYIAKA